LTNAATAIANDLPLYTCNPDDFEAIGGLSVHPVSLPSTP
jgi:predicted nucleic acid-binding protein